MNVKQHFSDLKSALEGRNVKITDVLAYYRTESARIKARYSETVSAEKLAQLEADARATIQRHDEDARDKAGRIVDRLKEALAEHITGGTDTGLLAQLQTVQTFNLHLTRSEIEAMAAKSNGNPVTLAALAQAAERSNFHVTYTTTAELEGDLKKILDLFHAPSFYTPDEYFHEAVICHPNRVYQGIDYGRPDATAITVGMGLGKSATRDLEEIATRWSDPGKIELMEFTPTM